MNAAWEFLRGLSSDAQGKGAEPVVIDAAGLQTQADLLHSVARVAWALRDLPPGRHVFLIGQNSFGWISFYLAALARGLTVVPLSSTASPELLAKLVSDLRPGAAFLDGASAARHGKLFDGTCIYSDQETGGHLSLSSLPAAGGRLTELVVGDNPVAAVMFTSGSTAAPSGVIVSHANLVVNTDAIIASLGIRALDRVLAVLPFFYCFGASLLHTHLRAGGSIVLLNDSRNPNAALDAIDQNRCTAFAGVPAHFKILLQRSDLGARRLPSLRYVQQAGGRLGNEDVLQLRTALADHVDIYVNYGQTEATARLACLPPTRLLEKLGSIGLPLPGVELKVVGDDGLELPPGAPGQLIARGGNVAMGYLGDPEATRRTFVDGWLHTGDLAEADDEGFLYIRGRLKRFLKIAGVRVNPDLIEQAAMAAGTAIECHVIGIDDDAFGEAACLFVVPKDTGFSESALLSFLRSRLPFAHVPREIHVVAEIPRSERGKIAVDDLRTLRRKMSQAG